MGTTLEGKQINQTYQGLLKTTDNNEVSSSAKEITDGKGNGTGVTLDNSGNIIANGTITANYLAGDGSQITNLPVAPVNSVNGEIGDVVLDTDDIAEGSNKYYTDERVSANTDVVANSAKVGITTEQADAIVANTAKVGITEQQALDIVTNNSKVTRRPITAGGNTLDTSETLTIAAGENVTITEADGTVTIASSGGGGGGAVDSVNGETGVVVLDTDDISEGATNLYYTDARVSANTDVVANAANIATNASNIASNNTDISSLQTDVSTNTTNIATNVSDISTNSTSIATNATNIATNTSNISSNDTDIATNAGNIATNTSNISQNTTDIATNASGISTNASNISTNTSNISSNTTNIATNTSNVATNAANIATNESNITTNATNISTNASGISANATAISTNASNIATNTTDIATNASGISTNATNIASNTSSISTNTSNISSNSTAIATNAANIASNDTDIATNASNISTNASGISTNATNISTNADGITTNATAITGKVSKDGDTMTGDLSVVDSSNNIGLFADASTRRVGIGTTGPSATLDVNGTTELNGNTSIVSFSNPTLLIRNTDTSLGNGQSIGEIDFYQSDFSSPGAGVVSTIQCQNESSIYGYGSLVFKTGTVTSQQERMRIRANGDVRVGVTSSDYFTLSPGAGIFSLRSTQFNPSIFLERDNDGEAMFFLHSAGGAVGNIYMTDIGVSYNTFSDYRLKDDLQPMDNVLERLNSLKPVNFSWKKNGSRVDGFLAHEVADIIPEAVTGTKDEMQEEEYEIEPAVYEDVVIPAQEEIIDEYGNVIQEATEEKTKKVLVSEAITGTRMVPKYQGIDQAKIVPLLTAALQEAVAKIESLEARVQALENK